MAKKTFFQRVLRFEPAIALGQWVYDTIAINWALIVSLFVAGGGMTYLSAITEWTAAMGPAGIGAIGLFSALTAYVAISLAQLLRAKRRAKDTEARAIDYWKEQADTINPLEDAFHRKRIRLADMAHPVDKNIKGKKFTECQLMGPANVFIFHGMSFLNVEFIKCDLVLTKQEVALNNVIILENSSFLGGQIIETTIYVHPSIFDKIRAMPGVIFANLTGDSEIDSRSHRGIGA